MASSSRYSYSEYVDIFSDACMQAYDNTVSSFCNDLIEPQLLPENAKVCMLLKVLFYIGVYSLFPMLICLFLPSLAGGSLRDRIRVCPLQCIIYRPDYPKFSDRIRFFASLATQHRAKSQSVHHLGSICRSGDCGWMLSHASIHLRHVKPGVAKLRSAAAEK